MEIKPVRKYAAPRIPTHEILDQHPELMRIVPRRWSSNPIVLAALAGACLLLDASRAASAPAKAAAPVSRVAPIFVHGGGSGGYGCVAVAAPLYLTEDEARRIINEEAKLAGITFKSPGAKLSSVEVPVIGEFDTVVPRTRDGKLDKIPAKFQVKQAPLEMDGTDSKRNISYEFVSSDDFEDMAKDAVITCTWISNDILGSAALLRKGLEKRDPSGYSAVFYDPVVWTKDRSAQLKATDESKDTKDPMEEAGAELRAQVKDFIKWLKGQGVI